MADPAGDWNRYAYTAGDPVNRADRQGLAYEFCGAEYADCSGGSFFEMTGFLPHEAPYACKDHIWNHGIAWVQWDGVCGPFMVGGSPMWMYAMLVQAFQINEVNRQREYSQCMDRANRRIDAQREADERAAQRTFQALVAFAVIRYATNTARAIAKKDLPAAVWAYAELLAELSAIHVNRSIELGRVADEAARKRREAEEDCKEQVNRAFPPMPRPS